MPNLWGFTELPNTKRVSDLDRGSPTGVGRRARQDDHTAASIRNLVLPIDFIGPSIDAIGAFDLPRGAEYTKLGGDKPEPSALLPPDVKLTDDQRSRLAAYLDRELSLCESERDPYIRKLARLKYKYRTEYPEHPKDWPIANASQITIPVIKTAVDTIEGRLFQTVAAAEPLARYKTEDEQFTDFAFDFEEFMRLYTVDYLDFTDTVLDPHVKETVILGTSVLEVTNWKDQKSMGVWDPSTSEYIKETLTCHSGPTIFHFPIEDFWIRPGYQDHQKAPWCGKELRLTWTELKDMAFSGELNKDFIARIARFQETHGDTSPIQNVDEYLEKFRPNYTELYHIFELAVRWDVDGDGLDEELILYYHKPSRTILRVKFNNFYKGRRPWIVTRYKLIPHRFYGEGLAEGLEHLQDEISTIHNQRIDNATIVNLRIILVAKLIQGMRPGDRLWSGKIVKVGNVKEDVGTLQMGEVYPSTVQNETIAQSYVHQLSGAGEAAMGQAQPVSRTTATAQMALLEELNRRFDKPLRNIRKTVREVHRHLSDLFMEQGTGGLADQWLGPVRGRRVEGFLQLPPELINRKLKVQVSATRSSNNREIEFQTQVAVMNLIIQQGQQMLALVQNIAPQATAMIAYELVKTIRPVFRKVMAYADAGDPDQAVAVLDVLERVLRPPEDMGGMAAARQAEMASMGAGGVPGVPGVGGGGPPGASQLAELERMVASAVQNGNGGGGVSVPATAGGRY